MTAITHHPSEALLVGYASGALEEAQALLVASHIEMCDLCRHTVADAETIGGALVSALTPERMGPDSLARTLARLDDAEAVSSARPSHGNVADVRLPNALRPYLDDDLESLPWRKAGRQIAHAVLTGRKSGTTARLVRLAPGTVIPQHTHGGEELTLVLTGAFSDERGVFRRGDVAEVDGGLLHQPVVESEEECMNLVVTDAPLRFKNLLPRLAQPFIGF